MASKYYKGYKFITGGKTRPGIIGVKPKSGGVVDEFKAKRLKDVGKTQKKLESQDKAIGTEMSKARDRGATRKQLVKGRKFQRDIRRAKREGKKLRKDILRLGKKDGGPIRVKHPKGHPDTKVKKGDDYKGKTLKQKRKSAQRFADTVQTKMAEKRSKTEGSFKKGGIANLGAGPKDKRRPGRGKPTPQRPGRAKPTPQRPLPPSRRPKSPGLREQIDKVRPKPGIPVGGRLKKPKPGSYDYQLQETMKPDYKRKKMKEGGKALKPVDKQKNPGLAKLPTHVRNKMGYMKNGGSVNGKMTKKEFLDKAGASEKEKDFYLHKGGDVSDYFKKKKKKFGGGKR